MQGLKTIYIQSAWIASPIKQKLKKTEPNTFSLLNNKNLQVMATLKNALISSPVLALLHPSGHMTLYTDASNVQIGYAFAPKAIR